MRGHFDVILIGYLLFFSLFLSAQNQLPPFLKDQYQFEAFQLPGGKLENTIQCMTQDSSGVLWFGTQNGLVKYDGRQYERLLHHPSDSNSLISSYVECIYVDRKNRLWIGAFDQGYTIYTPEKNLFERHYIRPEKGDQQITIGVNAILEYKEDIWLGTHNGLMRINSVNGEVKHYYDDPNYTNMFSANVVRALYVDSQETLWIGIGFSWSPDPTNGGLYKYLPNTDTFEAFRVDPTIENGLSDNRVKGIFEDSKYNFWIGTMGDGLHLMNRRNKQFTSFPFNPAQPNQLSRPVVLNTTSFRDNAYPQVQFIHEDSDEKLWIGSFDGGLNIYDPNTKQQIHFERGMNGLETNNIWNIFETTDNVLFICTGGDGDGQNYKVKFNKKLFSFHSIKEEGNIDEIVEDEKQQIWLGGNFREWVFNPTEQTVSTVPTALKKKIFLEELAGRTPLLSNLIPGFIRQFGLPVKGNSDQTLIFKTAIESYIKCIKKDKAGNVWMGTWGQGLFIYNPNTNSLKSFKYDKTRKNSIGGNHVTAIQEDQQGNIWVGGGKEIKHLDHPFFLDRYDATADTFIHAYLPNTEYGYPPMITPDTKGNLWYPTVLGGIHQLNIKSGTITKYNLFNSQIPSDDIHALVIAPDNHIWMTTAKTIVRLTPNRQSFIEYGEMEGIQIAHFVHGSGYISQNNTIYFGGKGGFHFFNPIKVVAKENLTPPNLLISEVLISDNSKQNHSLKKLTNLGNSLKLKHTENSLSIGFTAIDNNDPNKVHLEYQLENQDIEWRNAGNTKTARYNNLNPGAYLFKIRGANSRGLWNQNEQTLAITIAPPWYQTNWAYLLFSILIGLLFYGLNQFQLNRQLAKLEKERLAELAATKVRFYTNLTHEFRTPLTVILGMAAQIKQEPTIWLDNGIKMIERNSQQLLSLINQMLDLQKLTSGNLPVNLIQGEIVEYIKYIHESFSSYAESKGIRMHFFSKVDACWMDYDAEKLLNIYSNLLSNAIKFSKKDGDIYTYLDVKTTKEQPTHLEIVIKDEGVGISTEKIPYIFDRFYQADDSDTRQKGGTGIGLALTKELVQLAGGTITAKSQLGKGTSFHLLLPISNKAEKHIEIQNLLNIALKEIEGLKTNTNQNQSTKITSDIQTSDQLILIIEDNEDVRFYLESCLSHKYPLIFAENGAIGIQKAIKYLPNIIISDVMMPEKDGFEVCKTLKTDEKTSHIPIILLTAKADINSKISGLERGADAYLIKPFEKKELLVRVEKLLELRQKLQAHYATVLVTEVPNSTKPDSIIAKDSQIENVFLKKVNKVLAKHYANANFEIPKLSQALHMSQSQAYRKIKALTGKSIVAYLRDYRLQKAMVLLQNSEKTVSDIAYEVGFTDPAYFSRLFSEAFGQAPSEIRK